MEIRIGVVHALRDIEIELPSGSHRDEITQAIQSALSGETAVFTMKDRQGKDFFVPTASIAYIELSGEDNERRIGFGID